MSTRQLNRAIQTLLEKIRKLSRILTKGFISWLLRGLLVLGRQPLLAKAGFVLPTTVLLLLVVTLTVGSIGYRTYTRTQQTIGQRQQQVIYNAATPAIDRAKAKLEFLFDAQKDTRFPGGIPSENWLMGMMVNDGKPVNGVTVPTLTPDPNSPYDPYTFPDEQRFSIDGDSRSDNAWKYTTDTDGDGVQDALVAYSIVFQTPANGTAAMRNSLPQDIQDRAGRLQVRQAPLSNLTELSTCRLESNQAAPPIENGWFRDESNTSILRKNFQVDAYVLPINPDGTPTLNGTVSTLEFQQDRQLTRGNKWGAWFRNDLEIFPGPQFKWNGAMHTEGNLIVGGDRFEGYLISSPDSCLYTKDASEITIAINPAREDAPEFVGQFITGTTKENNFSGGSVFHIYAGPGQQPTYSGNTPKFNSSTDSVKNSGTKPADFALDPIRLQTQSVSQARNIPNFNTVMDGNWDKGAFTKDGSERMRRQAERAPYVDDTYRADNRYGPKPAYGVDKQIPEYIGLPIASDPELIGNDPGPGQDATSVGLDGYWERRARREGLRLIVGQRLELGDPAGWGGPQNQASEEPLLPFSRCDANNSGRCAESRQRKTLWDNLAAVQATAVYYPNTGSGTPNPDIPAACLATTVHPGTASTLARSATFEKLSFGLNSSALDGVPLELVISNFLRGMGTNGWEYNVPAPSTLERNTPMWNALKNLALYAGDPAGGAPSFPPQQGLSNVPHPYPWFSMWGDFSNLRNVLSLMEKGASFNDLSPADKSTLYTSACTMGMLAFNIDYLEKINVEQIDSNLIGVSPAANGAGTPEALQMGLKGHLRALLKADTSAAKPGQGKQGANYQNASMDAFLLSIQSKIQPGGDYANKYPEIYVRLLEMWRDRLTNQQAIASLNESIALARLIIDKEQVARDRLYGFSSGPGLFSGAPLGSCAVWNKENTNAQTGVFDITKNPLQLFCSTRPHYPILYSLFTADAPTVGLDDKTKVGKVNYTEFQEHGEDAQRSRPGGVVTDPYLRSVNVTSNPPAVYKVIQPSVIALRPRYLSQWTLPLQENTAQASVSANSPLNNRDNLILCTSCPQAPGSETGKKFYNVAFKDAAFFNGREMMSVRTLDLDLNLMRKTKAAINNNSWLPQSGIIYAFREDAVSENNIVRPASLSADWTLCSNNSAIQQSPCRMNADGNLVSAFTSIDPPVNENNRISPKPVDYYPDPDRRPHGFRLRKGAFLRRDGDDGRGLSFISDNPVYIQGDFNLHQSIGGAEVKDNGKRLEEFTTLLSDDFTPQEFYGRKRVDLNTDAFSQKDKDHWRPSEILADAISILSDNFCDGSIEDGFVTVGASTDVQNRYGCSRSSGTTSNVPANVRTSYINQDRPTQRSVITPDPARGWLRTNIIEGGTADALSPIVMSRNGDPMLWNSGSFGRYDRAYQSMTDNKDRIEANSGIRVNAILISGLVPSRPNQAYGGLHNFPRFLENWEDKKLYISGSFIQLSFSNYATAPYDQDAFEPGASTANAELIKYYEPPDRLWGYDVGLQYAPAGPIAQRFVTSQAIRSEFYSEPPANDPYIRNLCRQVSSICP
jgi:hypothetical protein